MNILSQIYQTDLPKIIFFERKFQITSPKTIVKGGFKVGKTYLIYDYLSQFSKEQFLYIDLDDYKNTQEEIASHLQEFLNQHKQIEVLVLENFDFSFELPKLDSVIITTPKDMVLEDFQSLFVYPLDFEEYLLFDTKHQSTTQSFNSFLKFGNFPEIIEFSESKKIKRNYEICKLASSDATQFEILMLLVKSSGEKKSIFQLFNTLKKTIKISKDRFYNTCENYEQNKVIFFVEKFDQPKAVKKLFVLNHALLDMVSYKKNFNNLFKNMVFLELQRRFEDIFYLDYIDFYIPSADQIILAIPFFTSISLGNSTSKLIQTISKYNITQITIVTISNEQTIYLDRLECSVVSFSNWILSL